MKIQLLLCATLCCVVSLARAGQFLTEKPDFLNPCSINDPNFTNCFASNAENILNEWKTDVPGLKSAGSIDPLSIKRISIESDLQSPIAINLDLEQVEISGLSDAICSEASFHTDPLRVRALFVLPKLTISGDYNISGHIVDTPLDGTGRASLTVDTTIVELNIRFIEREDRGFIFTDVERLHMDLQEIGGLHLQLSNPSAENSANAYLSDNSGSIFEVLRPSLNGALGRIMKGYWAKIFAYVPATYFFSNLPVNARHRR